MQSVCLLLFEGGQEIEMVMTRKAHWLSWTAVHICVCDVTEVHRISAKNTLQLVPFTTAWRNVAQPQSGNKYFQLAFYGTMKGCCVMGVSSFTRHKGQALSISRILPANYMELTVNLIICKFHNLDESRGQRLCLFLYLLRAGKLESQQL